MNAALAPLQVWDSLEIGPVRVEPRRLIMPYRVGEARQDLIYRYHEDVFDPLDPAAHKLATLIGAQLALNYGLFAKTLRIHGPLDASDRDMLRAMADTAREIYVNKLRMPNPFLRLDAIPGVPEGASFMPTLRFDRTLPAQSPPWTVDRDRVLVLSSGGKDSLLSQGLLEEIGVEVHPIFANEAGRHWYTALNAWRHLEAKHPNAARVWTNCDRVFSWALRQLPFIRPDFDRVRADIYPIRLWTVAVFLFGTLPLMKKRGLGRMVIGDEFDTSLRQRFEGIPHYAGLYDQSRWFDEALTRYYDKKGWGIEQLSILRPASEFTIQRTLVERYPGLQALQVSCHSAHIEGDRVKPCGDCEKCRRIIGMLTALGRDPAKCGYSPAQVSAGLKGLAGSSVKQIAEDASHLAWHLVEGGHIPADSPFGARAARSIHTERLRFDPTASPAASYPPELRLVLMMLAEHAEGAAERQGRVWQSVDPATMPLGPSARVD